MLAFYENMAFSQPQRLQFYIQKLSFFRTTPPYFDSLFSNNPKIRNTLIFLQCIAVEYTVYNKMAIKARNIHLYENQAVLVLRKETWDVTLYARRIEHP